MRFTPLLVLLLLLLPGSLAADEPELPAGQDFGAGLTLREQTALAEVVRSPERFAERAILVRGRISDVCQRKGCWTIIRDGTARLRVRFKDYGFFVPKDSAGAEALVEGVVTVEMLSEEDARHYEEEARDGDPDAVRGPRREIGSMASGVRLLPRS